MRQHRRRGFTLIEILVVIGIISVLMAFLLPALEKAREQANNVRCANNLSQIGLGLLLYANDNRGAFPRTVYDPAAPLCIDTNAAGPEPFGAGGPQANDTTAPFFLLIRVVKLPPKLFADPYNDVVEYEPDPAPDPLVRSNFTDYKRNLAYSFANPYPSADAVSSGYKLVAKMNPGFALAADANPGDGPGKNSRNHERRGQNVLYADMHVDWQRTPKCGIGGDDIYINKNNTMMASPVDATDSVLLPAAK